MKKFLIPYCLLCMLCGGINMAYAADEYNQNNGMIVRISEIEVYPEYFDEYLTFAKEVAENSVAKEPGVIAIYPMMKIKNNEQIRILEIYQDDNAYKKHIASEHFKHYKTGTLNMVKYLDLVDMYQISPQAFVKVFKKAEE